MLNTLSPLRGPSRTVVLNTPGYWRSCDTVWTTAPPPETTLTTGCAFGSTIPEASVTRKKNASLTWAPAFGVSSSLMPMAQIAVTVAGTSEATAYQYGALASTPDELPVTFT